MILLYYLMFCVLIFSLSLSQVMGDENWPYQSCSQSRTDYVRRILDTQKPGVSTRTTTEAGTCVNCDSEKNQKSNSGVGVAISQIREVERMYRGAIPPRQCFLAGALKGVRSFPEKYYIQCNSQNTRKQGLVRPCINEDYVNMIWELFSEMSYCFGLSQHEANHTFRILNNESGFMFNVQNYNKARCLGQVTHIYAKEIHRWRDDFDERRQPFDTYMNVVGGRDLIRNAAGRMVYGREVVGRCPYLKGQILTRTQLLNAQGFDCQMTQDPRKCLFYTFLGLKQHLSNISKKLNMDFSEVEVDQFTNLEREILPLPIRLNEMLRVRRVVNGQLVNHVFRDNGEIHEYLRRRRGQYKLRKLTVDKVPLFANPEEVKWIINYWTHNGGPTVYLSLLTETLKELKRGIARPGCDTPPKHEHCDLQQRLQRGEGLSSQEFVDLYTEKLHKHYPVPQMKGESNENYQQRARRRRHEVSQFVNKVKENAQDIFKQGRFQSIPRNHRSFWEDVQANCLTN